jgi:hypothetical protein
MSRSLIIFSILAASTAVVPRFFVIGFTHILPGGLDHILFILGLFFLTRSFATLLFQMTLFTLAHSLSLGLSTYGIVSVPTGVVEIAIALSIAFIAVENLFYDHLSRWRPAMVFGFGLVHGLGFAHSSSESLLVPGDFLPALFSFNMGIEFGQLAVVGIAYAAVAAWWKRDLYPRLIARPASAMIAASGLYWAVERSL